MISDTAFFCMSIGHLYILLGEIYIQVLCPFFNWISCFLGVELYVVNWFQQGSKNIQQEKNNY